MTERKKRTKHFQYETDHNGEKVLSLSFSWPDRERFRRRMPNEAFAEKLFAKIQHAIYFGKEGDPTNPSWQELRRGLKQRMSHLQLPVNESIPQEGDLSIEETAAIYLEEWCRTRRAAPDYYEKELRNIIRIVGSRRLKDFTLDDANHYCDTRLLEVTSCTAQHGASVLSGMLRWALKQKKWIPVHPMGEDFEWPEIKRKDRTPLDRIEVERLVEEAMKLDDIGGRFIGFLSETALRIGELLKLKRHQCEIKNRQITIPPSKKNRKQRHVPLSPIAITLAAGLPIVFASELLFVDPVSYQPLNRTRIVRLMEKARQAAGISWKVRPHDLRHFRATTWLENGSGDLNAVREWMGHTNIATTEIYLQYVKHRATPTFHEGHQREMAKLETARLERAESGDKVATF